MIIVVYTPKHGYIDRHLGDSEYSYHFVLSAFRETLEKLGTVVEVTDPNNEVDAVFDICTMQGAFCVFLSFAPPQQTTLGLRCPTVPVFAWEFPDAPNETWDQDPRNDWGNVFARCAGVVTHSSFAADVVVTQFTPSGPIEICPAPVWDTYQSVAPPRFHDPQSLQTGITTLVIDSGDRAGCSQDPVRTITSCTRVDIEAVLNSPNSYLNVRDTVVNGIIYTSIFNPADGRKHWPDLVKVFCATFRDRADATLILKFVHADPFTFVFELQRLLYVLSPFRCRVIGIGGFLEPDRYERLLELSHYAVTLSSGEGQCLPLMEYMSAGRPAIAPRHTGMADYLDESNAFLVECFEEVAAWPHDPRHKLRTKRYRANPESVALAFARAHACAIEEPTRYACMSDVARERLREHCSKEVVEARLSRLLARLADRTGLA